MDIEIIKEKENPLLDRTEIVFNVSGTGPTPSRDEVKNKLVALLNSQYELVVLDKLATEYGTQKTVGYAKVYSDAAKAEQVENKYIVERNKPKPVEEVEEAEEEAAPEEEASGEESGEEPVEEAPSEDSTAEEPADEEPADEEAPEEEEPSGE